MIDSIEGERRERMRTKRTKLTEIVFVYIGIRERKMIEGNEGEVRHRKQRERKRTE